MAANRTILILEGLPMANLKAYVPNFPKHPWESRKSLKLRELCPSKVRWSRFVSLKNAVFSALFWRKSFFWPTSTKATPPHDRHIRKAVHLSFLHVPQHKSFFEPAGRQNFANASGLTWLHQLTVCPNTQYLSLNANDKTLSRWLWYEAHILVTECPFSNITPKSADW